ncbi:MAG: FTR1 family iron permease [Synergistaceae bacterium]|jgi:high-affinity iron transporter|nr:FTR1 family iron permease [Synergistaceae bacterium]
MRTRTSRIPLGFFLSLLLVLSVSALLFVPALSAGAAQSRWSSWSEIVDQMDVSLNKAWDAYFIKDVTGAKNWVNDAYFGYYEKEGVERAVLSYISGKRASIVEYQFGIIKKLMTEGAGNREVRASLDLLSKMLREDANQLDGKEESAVGVFMASLVIILREGFEAILVIAAIAAYLIRSGNGRQTRVVYASGVAALVASALAAVAIQILFEVSGANQEIIEGVAMLLAVVVLFFVSNWMISKAEAEAWKGYIEGKVQAAVETGSSFALGAAAFLAVFREGAETILFYQALLAETGTHTDMVWGGFAVGCVALVAIFALVRYGSLVIPIRAFFMGTSILMYIMSIAFAGGGIKELQEGDVISVTPVNFIESIDILGIYPTVETLLPQAVLLILAIVSVCYYRNRGRRGLKAAGSKV